MLVARKQCLGTIELPAQESPNSAPLDVRQDETLVELFHRLGQGGELCLLSSTAKCSLLDSRRFTLHTIDPEVVYAPADLVALEVELAQELSVILTSLQR